MVDVQAAGYWGHRDGVVLSTLAAATPVDGQDVGCFGDSQASLPFSMEDRFGSWAGAFGTGVVDEDVEVAACLDRVVDYRFAAHRVISRHRVLEPDRPRLHSADHVPMWYS